MRGLPKWLQGMADGSFIEKANLTRLHNEFDNVIVDTCFTSDTGKYETGIQVDDKPWVIVELYKTHADSVLGHTKWYQKMKENPKIKLVDVQTAMQWAFGENDD